MLAVQQGATELATAVKFSINDKNAVQKLVIDSTGHIGIGVDAPKAIQHIYADYSSDFFYGEMPYNDGWPTYKLLRARTNNGSKSAVVDGDFLGRFVMWGHDGTNYNRSGSFEVAADGTPTTGSTPGRMTFSTVPANSGTLMERMRITSAGNIGIGSTAPTQKLEVGGGVRINTSSAQPTCNDTTRGTFWFFQGGTGVKDTAQVCAKDAFNAYAWRTLY